ncbi:MFS transporter [Hamadaea tsunoensis]|uniref:MFS transporter n=1 Tax=Hamadaea tsunoensis TaxID=53368 RepID=UPI0012F70BA0|nr:MFS transporter [Hamadaea tsunoensis]
MSGLAVVTAARRYRTLLLVPGVTRVTVPSVIGRLPYGMTTLLFVVAVHYGTGSYAVAGLATAAHSAATALTAPWLGRLADRGHAPRVLAYSGVAYAALLTLLVAGLAARWPILAILAVVGAAGAVNPPIAAVTRVVLPRIAPDQAATAYALDTVFVELTYVIGPALVAAISAAVNPYAAVLATAAFAAAGALGLASAPAARRFSGAAPSSLTESSVSRRRLLTFALAALVLAGGLEAAAYGMLEVAIPAYATALGNPAGAGGAIAAWSAGSIIGGVWFSGLSPKMSQWRLFALLMTLNTVGFAAICLAGGLFSLGTILLLGGLVIAPTTTVEIALVTALAPAARRTEAFTWTSTGVFVGYSAGAALSGALASAGFGLAAAALVATGLVGLGALLAAGLAVARHKSRADDLPLSA